MASSPYMQRVTDFGTFHGAGRDMKTAQLECGHAIHVGNNCFRSRVVCWKCKEVAKVAATQKADEQRWVENGT